MNPDDPTVNPFLRRAIEVAQVGADRELTANECAFVGAGALAVLSLLEDGLPEPLVREFVRRYCDGVLEVFDPRPPVQ